MRTCRGVGAIPRSELLSRTMRFLVEAIVELVGGVSWTARCLEYSVRSE